MSKQPPKVIKVKGRVYRLASKEISVDDVKENIARAADRAALVNIADNLKAHAGHVQEIAEQMLTDLDNKNGTQKVISRLKNHCQVMQKFMEQVQPTYTRYTKKHQKKKRK